MRLISFTLLAIVVFASCKKEDGNYKLNGTIYNGNGSGTLSGTEVVVEKQTVAGGNFGASYTTAATGTTDGSGNFEIEWARENFAALRVTASKNQYITHTHDLVVSNFESGDPVTQNLTLYPEAYIQVSILNAGNTDVLDQMSFTFTNAQFDCLCCSNGFREFNGANVDTSFTCKLYGNSWLKYQKQIHTLELDTVANDSIWCPAFQTASISIQY